MGGHRMWGEGAQSVVALQKIHLNTQLDERERRRWATDLDVCKRSSECPYTVSFYGALVYEVGGVGRERGCGMWVWHVVLA